MAPDVDSHDQDTDVQGPEVADDADVPPAGHFLRAESPIGETGGAATPLSLFDQGRDLRVRARSRRRPWRGPGGERGSRDSPRPTARPGAWAGQRRSPGAAAESPISATTPTTCCRQGSNAGTTSLLETGLSSNVGTTLPPFMINLS
jgi:hypothetical protein